MIVKCTRSCSSGMLLAVLACGCGDDDIAFSSVDGGDAGGSSGECDAELEPSDDDTEIVQTALIEAASGDTICLAQGTYVFRNELSLAEHRDITLKGTGEEPDDVVLDFAEQTTGDDGVFVTADGFTIENVWIRNTRGNGIVVKADDAIFRDLKVSWDGEIEAEHGAYAVYPTNCNRVIVERVEVTGASDAGIYVGQCRGAIVRNNKAYGNVLGIEIENTIDADVYENEIYDNSAGILVDTLPEKELKESRGALIRDNTLYENNHENFGEMGTVVASVPPGTGIMVLAASETEIRDNTIRDHDGPGVVVVSYDIVDLLLGSETNDPETDRYPKQTYVHGNAFSDNGAAPGGAYAIIGVDPLEDVLWDGIVDPDLSDAAAVELCLGAPERASFRNFAAPSFEADQQSTDTSPHECTLDPLPELDF